MKITPRQMRWIDDTVTQKNPLQFRFEFALWTRDMVRTLLREEFGLRLSVSSVGRLLAQLGLTCQRPLFRAIEQDAERVARWQREESSAIHAEARQCRAVIWFGEESGMRSDYHAGTMWGIRGRTP